MSNGFASNLQRVKVGTTPLAALVTEDDVQAACQQEDYQTSSWVYTPAKTVGQFLGQVLSADGSCQEAVNGSNADRTMAGRTKGTADTGGYCKARQRIPENVFKTLMRNTGRQVEDNAPESWKWLGHRVRAVDGSTLKIADTAKNRGEYPLQRKLKPGLHYPVVRILVVFSLAVGTVLEGVLSPYKGKGTGETAMVRSVSEIFAPGDVLLGDRYFSGYWDVVYWLVRGVHVVSVISKSRRCDFRTGDKLGRTDHVVTWRKTRCPDWVDAETIERAPDELKMREVRIKVKVRGFRVLYITIVTTLTDAEIYSAEELGKLYRLRWQAELNLRSLKTHMGMEQLRCKSPAMVRKEFACYLTAYNCVRRLAADAASKCDLRPHQVSFKNTLQTMHEYFPRFHGRRCSIQKWLDDMLENIAEIQVANRPDRIEPYTCKKRPKDFPRPLITRQAYKARRRRAA